MANLKDEASVALRCDGTPDFESRGWQVDLARRELRVNGSAVPIGGRAFEIIETLVQSAGELVTKDDLMRRVWPGLVVGDNTVQVHIAAIRKALGADRNMLKTISGRGYRLLGGWTQHASAAAPAEVPSRGRPLAALPPFTTNVPVAASALVGRETAVRQLCDLLSAYRVVTLTGPGGIGKTVLASEVARRLYPTSEGDVLFIELASLSDPDLVPSTVAHILNLQLHGEYVSSESVARAIGNRRLLLVLDNCEHIIDAAASMAETLLSFCPHTTVLATSREVLRIEGEFVYRVLALEVPNEELENPEHVLEHSAVQLFIARKRSLRSDFPPENDNLSIMAAICRRLDGVPLAIEFAAARAATLGIQQVAARLDDRFSLLTGGRRTALPRHRTLRATLDWSYELLPEAERRLLRLLAIFPAGFTLEAAAAVAGDTASNVPLGISGLVSKSLVAMDGSEASQRWRLLETVRAYAFEKLVKSDEHGQAARRLADFCLELYAPFAAEGGLQSAIDELARYHRDVGNLRAALGWAFSDDGDRLLGVELAATATGFWMAASLVAECCEWADKALTHIGDAAGTRSEMVLQGGLGIGLIYTQGMRSRAREVLKRTLALAYLLEDFDYQQRAICGLWLFSARSMALNDAFAFAREHEVAVQDRDVQSQAIAAWLVGVPQTYLADHVHANERLQWAIDHYPVASRRRDIIRLGGDPRASSMAHRTVNLLSQGFLDAASRESRNAVEEARAANQPTVLCVSLAWAAAFISLSLGEIRTASDYSDELIDLAYKHGLRPFHAAGLCVRGSLAARRGEPDVGIGLLRVGLADMQEAMYLLFYPFFRVELAKALGESGSAEESSEEISETLRFAEETGYRWLVPEILRTKGDLLALGGHADPAAIEYLYRQSMTQACEHQAAYWELCAATSFAQLLQRQQRDTEAHSVLSPIYHRFTEGFSTLRVKQAKAVLEKLN
ncbi:winged helix-turn-helix domain-containing protein [Mesorhizobium amorphae]|uniref:ATP-binding protein n=1 Tax=Mesorhizobium amorphae TaxID=71433 RepID=UPI003ECEB5F9